MMHKSDDSALREYDEYIASALRTEGGHLSIGRGGFTCESAWNKDPVFGVIGIQSGPRG
jgi:hypothetical protein